MAKPTCLMLYGPPACGKGTQVRRLISNHLMFDGAFCISMGEILRDLAHCDQGIARETRAGRLVDNSTVCGLIAREIIRAKLSVPQASLILDGATRTAEQVIMAVAASGEFGYRPVFLEFKLADEVCRERAARQARESGRNDGGEINARLEAYHHQRSSVLAAAKERMPCITLVVDGLSVEVIEAKVAGWLNENC